MNQPRTPEQREVARNRARHVLYMCEGVEDQPMEADLSRALLDAEAEIAAMAEWVAKIPHAEHCESQGDNKAPHAGVWIPHHEPMPERCNCYLSTLSDSIARGRELRKNLGITVMDNEAKDVLSREIEYAAIRAQLASALKSLQEQEDECEALEQKLATALEAQQKAERERDELNSFIGPITLCKICNGTGKIGEDRAEYPASNCCPLGHEKECQCLVCQWRRGFYRLENTVIDLKRERDEARATIQRLEAEKREMREALKRIGKRTCVGNCDQGNTCSVCIARAALSGSPAAEGTKETKEVNNEV